MKHAFMEFKKPPESLLIVLILVIAIALARFPYFLIDRSKIDDTIDRRHAETLLPYLGLGGFIRARMWRFLAS